MATKTAQLDLMKRFATEDARIRRDDIASVMALPAGRRLFIWITHELCGVYKTTVGETVTLALDAGRRNVGLEVLMTARATRPEAVLEAENELETLTRKRAEEMTLAAEKDAKSDENTILGRLTGRA